MATDLFLEMAELPATGSLGTGQLDTRDLLVAGVPISISSKYLYLYLELSGSTPHLISLFVRFKVQREFLVIFLESASHRDLCFENNRLFLGGFHLLS